MPRRASRQVRGEERKGRFGRRSARVPFSKNRPLQVLCHRDGTRLEDVLLERIPRKVKRILQRRCILARSL